jgi:hypothetical protein
VKDRALALDLKLMPQRCPHAGKELISAERLGYRDQIERRSSVRSLQDLIPLGSEPHPQQLADRRLIIHDQNPDGRSAHAAVSNDLAAAGIGAGW